MWGTTPKSPHCCQVCACRSPYFCASCPRVASTAFPALVSTEILGRSLHNFTVLSTNSPQEEMLPAQDWGTDRQAPIKYTPKSAQWKWPPGGDGCYSSSHWKILWGLCKALEKPLCTISASQQQHLWHRAVFGMGWGVGDHTRPHRLGSGLLAPSGVLGQGHYPLMAWQGQRFLKPAGSPSPVLPTAKLFLLTGHLLIKAGEWCTQRSRAKCGEEPEEGLDMFQCPVAWFPPAHQVTGAAVLPMYPLLILTAHPA